MLVLSLRATETIALRFSTKFKFLSEKLFCFSNPFLVMFIQRTPTELVCWEVPSPVSPVSPGSPVVQWLSLVRREGSGRAVRREGKGEGHIQTYGIRNWRKTHELSSAIYCLERKFISIPGLHFNWKPLISLYK